MKERQADRLARILRRRIVSGKLEAHRRLVERDLAEEFDCSRIPVREALHRLEQEGFVDTRPRWGAFVRHLSKEEWEQAQEVRSLLEGHVLALVAKKQPSRAFGQLRRIVDKMETAARTGNDTRADELDLEFHRTLVSATGNRWLMELYPRVATAVIPLTLYKHARAEVLLESAARHEALLRVLMSGDAAAARLAGQRHRDTAAELAGAAWGNPPSPRRKQGKKRRV